jgi:hypothetical protein
VGRRVIHKVKNNLTKLTKLHKSEAFKKSRFSRANLTVFAIIFASIGGYLIYRSFAAGLVVSIEVENGALTPPASLVNDASASGGKAVHWGTALACSVSGSNKPDAIDPWGGCFPGPTNTGVPAGTTLTAYTGSCTITAANLTLTAKTINCAQLIIAAANVTIQNSQVNGYPWIDDPTPNYSFHVIDSNITNLDPFNNSPQGLGKSHFTVLRANISGGVKGVWCEYDCSVTDTYIHGTAQQVANCSYGNCAVHESSIRQGSGTPGSGVNGGVETLTHNSIICDAITVAANDPFVPGDTAGCSADISGYGDFDYIQYNNFSRNLIMPPGDGVCAYGGASSGRPFMAANHNVWTDNIFQRGNKPSQHGLFVCGYYGVIADFDASITGNIWTNNRFDDGTTPANGTVIPSTNVQF